MIECLDHDRLAAEFFNGLLTQLRHHGTEQDCLEGWVPDENPVKSVLNMVEAVEMAGRNTVAIAVPSSRLSPEQVVELSGLLEGLGHVEVTKQNDRLVVTVRGLQDEHCLRTLPVSLRRHLRPHAHHPTYQGTLPVGAAGSNVLTITDPDDQDITLSVCVESTGARTILAARHTGAADPVLRGVLDVLCKMIESRPLREACDHGALRALHAVKDPDLEPPVAGIALPVNVHPAFGRASRLIRLLLATCPESPVSPIGDSAYELQPGTDWIGLSDGERLAAVATVIDRHLQDLHESPGTLRVCGIGNDPLNRPVRVKVAFASPPRAVPAALLRSLESQIKRQIDATLQTHLEELQDSSKIRRLSSASNSS